MAWPHGPWGSFYLKWEKCIDFPSFSTHPHLSFSLSLWICVRHIERDTCVLYIHNTKTFRIVSAVLDHKVFEITYSFIIPTTVYLFVCPLPTS